MRNPQFDRIAAGGLASSTEARLRELTRWGGFSSFFGAPELWVGESAGVHPVGQVVGLAAGEITAGYVKTSERWKRPLQASGVSTDLTVVADARWQEHPQAVRGWDELRRRALGRLIKQAEQLKCHAVVGVEPRRVSKPVGEAGAAEVVLQFSGTAVTIDGWKPHREPVLTLLGVNEVSLLLRGGVEPTGIVGGVGRIEMRPSALTVSASRRRGFAVPNVELADLTQAVYEVRHAAMKALRKDAARLDATGVLDVTLELERDGLPTQPFGSVVFTAFALASAVRRTRNSDSQPPQLAVSMNRSAHG